MRPPRLPSEWFAVHRRRNCVHFRQLTEAHFDCMTRRAKGLLLAEACELALRDRSRPKPEDLRRWFVD